MDAKEFMRLNEADRRGPRTGAGQTVPLDSLVGCDHDLGFTYDYEGPSIFSVSTKNPTWEFDEGFIKEDDHHGIVYWNFCPKCGQKLNPPNVTHEAWN